MKTELVHDDGVTPYSEITKGVFKINGVNWYCYCYNKNGKYVLYKSKQQMNGLNRGRKQGYKKPDEEKIVNKNKYIKELEDKVKELETKLNSIKLLSN